MRVKVFRLSEEKSSSPSPQSVWIDCGIGLLEFREGEEDGSTKISVISEADTQNGLISHALSTEHMYERQGPSIIRFTEVDEGKSIDLDGTQHTACENEAQDGIEFALSFHQTLDCNEVWAEVQKVLPDDQHDLGVLHPTFRRVCYPHVNTFHKLAQLYGVSMDPSRHDMADGLVHMCLHVGWFESLFELFDRYEAEEAYENLESMHNMFLAIFMLDDPQIFQILLLKEENLMKTIACLEYDANKRLKQQRVQNMSTGAGDVADASDDSVSRTRCDQHRRFLQSAKLKMPIDLPNEPNGEPLYTKITTTYRMTYIHDVILLPYVDDDASPNFNDLIYAQRDAIAHRLAGSPQFLKELFSQLMMPDESTFSAVESESDFSSVREHDEEGDCGNSPPIDGEDEATSTQGRPGKGSNGTSGDAHTSGDSEVHHVSLGNLFIKERGTDTSSCPPTPSSTTSESRMGGGDHGDTSSLLSHHSARFEMFQFFDDMKKLFSSLRIDIKGECYKAMYEQGVFLCLEQVAFEVDPVNTPGGLQIWISICDTLNTYSALNVAFLRTFLTTAHLARPQHFLDSLMATFCMPNVDDGLGRQCFEIAKLVFNAETMNDDEKRRFIPFLYNTQMSRIVDALDTAPMFTPSPWTQRYSATEFLTFVVRSHSTPRITLNIHPNFRDCYVEKRIFERVFGGERTSVIHSAHKNEVLAAIRFLREVVGLKDPRYIDRIARNNMMDPVMNIYVKFGAAYNLMNSAVLDLLKFISDNNLDSIILYLGEHHMRILRGCDHAGTFAKLLRQYSTLAKVPVPPPMSLVAPVRPTLSGKAAAPCSTPGATGGHRVTSTSSEEFLTPSRPSKSMPQQQTGAAGALPRTPLPQSNDAAASSSISSPDESSRPPPPFPTTPTTPKTAGTGTGTGTGGLANQQIAGIPMSFCTTPPRTPDGARHRTPMPKMRAGGGRSSSFFLPQQQQQEQGGDSADASGGGSGTAGEKRCVVAPSSDGGGSSQALLEQFSALDNSSKSSTNSSTSSSSCGGLSAGALLDNTKDTICSPSSLILGEAGDSSPHTATPMVLSSPSNSNASAPPQISQPAPLALTSLMQGGGSDSADPDDPLSNDQQKQIVHDTESKKCGIVATGLCKNSSRENESPVNVHNAERHVNTDDERKIDSSSPATIYSKSKISQISSSSDSEGGRACMMNIVQSQSPVAVLQSTKTNVCTSISKTSPTITTNTRSSTTPSTQQAKKQKLSPPPSHTTESASRRISPVGKRKVSPDKETQDQYEAGAKTAKFSGVSTAVADRSALKETSCSLAHSPGHGSSPTAAACAGAHRDKENQDVTNFLNMSARSPSIFDAAAGIKRGAQRGNKGAARDGSGGETSDVEMSDGQAGEAHQAEACGGTDDFPSKRRKMP